MGDKRPWKHQNQPQRPFKAWIPNCSIMVRASRVMAEADAEAGAKATKAYGFAWDERDGQLLTCYVHGLPMGAVTTTNVLRTMADDKTAREDNRRTAKRILKAIKAR